MNDGIDPEIELLSRFTALIEEGSVLNRVVIFPCTTNSSGQTSRSASKSENDCKLFYL
jgi:hypothetical protein